MCQKITNKDIDGLINATPELEAKINGQNRDASSADVYKRVNLIFKSKRAKKVENKTSQMDQMQQEMAETKRMLATMQSMLEQNSRIRSESPHASNGAKVKMVDGIDVSHLPSTPLPGGAPTLDKPVKLVDNRPKKNQDDDNMGR